jgi:hypothetical protein
MALQAGKPNRLNYFNLRRVEFPAAHFEYTILTKYDPAFVNKINMWIYKNLNHRYYVGCGIMLDSSNTIVYNTHVGFESVKELSFFTITCLHLQNR